MGSPCQGHRPGVVAVAGAAGSGTSTLGRALAVALRLPLLDLDAITGPLIDRLLGPSRFTSSYDPEIREARYAALRAVARDVIGTAGGAVLVAPFTAEIRGGAEWAALLEAVAPADLRLLFLDGDRELLAERRAGRGEPRDAPRAPHDGNAEPAEPGAEPDRLRGPGGAGPERRPGKGEGASVGAWAASDAGSGHSRGFAESRTPPDDAGSRSTEPRTPSGVGPDPGSGAPAVPHIVIDADLTPGQQLFRARRTLGHRMAVDPDNDLFARSFDAVLCDLDGVLADSTASVTRSWRRFAREFGVSARALQENHGQPARTLVEKLLGPGRVAEGLARIGALEVGDAATVAPVLGAPAFFAGLPEHRRAVVTSGDRAIATARLRAAGLPEPRVLITIDDVRRGKPDPEPYLAGARRLRVPPQRCLVVEDAPAGIAAARAAGCRVLAVGGTESVDALAGADLVVDALDRVVVRPDGDALRLVLVTDDIVAES